MLPSVFADIRLSVPASLPLFPHDLSNREPLYNKKMGMARKIYKKKSQKAIISALRHFSGLGYSIKE